MRILSAHDLGLDGVELLVWLDEAKTRQGPDGPEDLRPDPSWLWRATIPGREWATDQLTALQRVARLADGETRRRSRAIIADLVGVDLGNYLPEPPAEEPAP